jgi:hypothetical protein
MFQAYIKLYFRQYEGYLLLFNLYLCTALILMAYSTMSLIYFYYTISPCLSPYTSYTDYVYSWPTNAKLYSIELRKIRFISKLKILTVNVLSFLLLKIEILNLIYSIILNLTIKNVYRIKIKTK